MITFPCCKINLGLNVVGVRADGFHNIETVFYPVPLTDVLEIKKMDDRFPCVGDIDIHVSGDYSCGDEEQNLVVKAYNLIATDYEIPRIHAHLYKRIPVQSGLGGGSADGAFMIRLLDERFRLNMGNAEMERYASKLGADCPFFISAEPSYATGKGDELEPADNEYGNLHGYWIAIVRPDVSVSTAEAYKRITPKEPQKNCRMIVRQPIETWREELTNDFEQPVFSEHPELEAVKEQLYSLGAVYAQMSGSGSALYGIFREQPQNIEKAFDGSFTSVMRL